MPYLAPIALNHTASQLPLSKHRPDCSKMTRLGNSGWDCTLDAMSYSLWQDPCNRAIWINVTGGIASIDYWYGPGDPCLIAHLSLQDPSTRGSKRFGA